MSDSADRKPAEKKKERRKRHANVLFYGAECKYPVIQDLVREMGWTWVDEGSKLADNCHLYWIDVANIQERFAKVQSWQRVNHFPGMPHIARKTRMAQNLDKMRRAFPLEYNFYPRTWVLPNDFADFRTQFDANGRSKTVFIIKPDGGCQGRGIFLTQNIEDVSPADSVVAQQYITRPLLIDDFKFDLRIYVFVASCKPLRMYIFKDGLVRLCTEEYVVPNAENLGSRCVHLTNYSVNKKNANFEQNNDPTQESASKRSVQWFLEWLDENHGAGKSKTLWNRIKRICARTIITILPLLAREYETTFKLADQQHMSSRDPGIPTSPESDSPSSDARAPPPDVKGSRCFEVLGFDIMVQANLQPRLIEVNHLPSFGTDSALDYDVKSRLLGSVLRSLPVAAHDPLTHQRRCKYLSEERLTRAQRAPSKSERDLKAQIREVFAKVYPAKADQVETLLDKYQGKEDKFLAWLESKLRTKNNARENNSARRDDADENGDGAPAPATVPVENGTTVAIAAGDEPTRDKSPPAQPLYSASVGESDDPPAKAPATAEVTSKPENVSRVPRSNPSKKRASDAKKEEERLEAEAALQRRQAVLATFCCSEDDPEFVEERKFLSEFDVIFPTPKSTAVRDEDPDEQDENNANGAGNKSPRQKKRRATLEDLICHAFELDYKQMIRLRHPMHRRPSDASTIRSAGDQSRGVPGVGLPPRPPNRDSSETDKKVLRVPDAAQVEAADRLMKGFSTIKSLSAPTSLTDPDMLADMTPPSSAPDQGRDLSPLKSEEMGNFIQLPPIDRRRTERMDGDTTIGLALAQRISRLQQEGRQLRQRTQNRHNERKAVCTAIVRQQVFSFASQFPSDRPVAGFDADPKRLMYFKHPAARVPNR